MKAVLYVAHGTRSIKGAHETRGFIKRVMKQVSIPIQEMSFLELAEPCIEEAFVRCVERGAVCITVVPLFLLAAGHIKQDIPQILSSLQERYPYIPIYIENPFGVQREVLDAASELVRRAAGRLCGDDCLLIVGRGSSDPQTIGDFSLIAKGIKKRLGIKHVSVCYLAAASPRFKESLDALLEKMNGRIIILPYLLFSGILSAEIELEIRKRYRPGQLILNTGPLSSDHTFKNIIIERANSNKLLGMN